MTQRNRGQALTSLLVIVVVAMTITSAAISITLANTQAASITSLGDEALTASQSGIDNALLRLLRDPSYSGETVSVGTIPVTVTVTGTTTKTIMSSATVLGQTRTIIVTATASNQIVTVDSWTQQ